MRKYILFMVFMVLLVDIMFGIGLNIAMGVSFKNLALYSVIIMIMVDAVMHPEGVHFSDLDVHLPFVVLIVMAMFSWAVYSAIDPTYGSRRALIYLKNGLVDHYLFFLAFRYGLSKGEDFLWLLKAIVTALLVSSVFTVVDFLNIPDLGVIGTHKGRVEGPVGAANQYGALLVFLIPMFIALIHGRSGRKRTFWIFGIAVSMFLLVATGSRGSYVAAMVGYPVAVVFLRRYLDMKQVGKMMGLAAIVIALAGITYAVLLSDVLESIIEKSTKGNLDQASSGRLFIWTAGLKLMVSWPASFIFGFGWDGFRNSGIPHTAHNVYLTYLFEMGVVGLFMFLYLIWVLLHRTRKILAQCEENLRRINIAYIFGVLAIVCAIFFVALPRPWMIIWTITGLVLGLQAHPAIEGAIEDGRDRQSPGLKDASSARPGLGVGDA